MPISIAARQFASAVPCVSWRWSAITAGGTWRGTAARIASRLPRVADADGVAERHLVQPMARSCGRSPASAAGSTFPSYGQPQTVAHVGAHQQARAARRRHDLLEERPAIARSILLTFLRLCVSQVDMKTATSPMPAATPARARCGSGPARRSVTPGCARHGAPPRRRPPAAGSSALDERAQSRCGPGRRARAAISAQLRVRRGRPRLVLQPVARTHLVEVTWLGSHRVSFAAGRCRAPIATIVLVVGSRREDLLHARASSARACPRRG